MKKYLVTALAALFVVSAAFANPATNETAEKPVTKAKKAAPAKKAKHGEEHEHGHDGEKAPE